MTAAEECRHKHLKTQLPTSPGVSSAHRAWPNSFSCSHTNSQTAAGWGISLQHSWSTSAPLGQQGHCWQFPPPAFSRITSPQCSVSRGGQYLHRQPPGFQAQTNTGRCACICREDPVIRTSGRKMQAYDQQGNCSSAAAAARASILPAYLFPSQKQHCWEVTHPSHKIHTLRLF